MYRIDMYLTNLILNLLTILLAVEVVTISSQDLSFRTPVFRGNRISLQWNGTTGLTYAIRVIPEGGDVTDYTGVKTTNFTVENALLFQHYTFVLYQGSVEKHRITYKTPDVVYASVGDDLDMTWPLSRFPGFGGYSIKNVDVNNVLIQFDGSSPPALGTKYRFLGDAMSLTNITSIRIPDVEVSDAGYIVSLKPQRDLGGAILAVHEKPSKPVIENTTNDFIIGKNVTLRCSSKQQSSPDYVTFGPLSYTWLDAMQAFPSRYRVNGMTLTILKIEKSDAQRSISCQASQDSKTSEMSDSLRMNVLYGPSGVTISTQQNHSLNIKEGDQIGPYSCTADCNPPCKIEWKFKGLDGKFKVLENSNSFSISNVIRTQSGIYRCRASTDLNVTSSFSRDDIKINVLYAPDKPNITINNSNSLVGEKVVRTENSSLALVCTANSNPPASMTWVKAATQQLHSTKSTGNITHVLRNVQCQDSAIYTCQANNGIGKRENTSFELEVQCVPRLYEPNVFQSKYGVELNNSLEINVTVTANPQPTFVWTADSPLSPSNTNVVKKPKSSFIFVLTSNFQITEQKHFGNYTFRVSNDHGLNEYTIAVTARGKPLPPSNFSYKDVQQTSINLTWISGFNGGSVQKFIIQRSTVAGWVLVGNVSDQGQGHEISHLVSGLSPGQRYAFRMYSFNRFGNNSESSLSLSVYTEGLEDPGSSSQGNIAGVAAGVAAFIVVLIISAVIVGVIYLLKKKQNQKGDTVTEDVFYAVVNNKPENGGHAADDADALYANDDDLSGAVNAQASGVQQRSKNQDGLVYIDVEFKSPSKEAGGKLGKPVIHGDDTRTDYMQVDFTRRGSPDLDATE